ncbi:hypothetical protein BDY21DRAFT_342938 [Lineolata rhizophorae]|uniref:Uncharacterized protein n=1 Tax=Lineolata rhizophorae TaxID=578093 RepID=A0A6A6P281_9PEZI|nr:hypothetical protein BDY21DRAFT_342938 [Lineolata rhizophorae]
MAPDLNSVPASPRNQPSASHSSSRRASQIFPMSPPPLPLSSPGAALPSGTSQHSGYPFPLNSPGTITNTASVSDTAAVPMRHPRPLTAAELHLELEKEQEAVVNRLTRELSALRAQSASVASTASSNTSGAPGLLVDTADAHTGSLTGPTHPTASRRHRSSSSVSRGSVAAATATIPLGNAPQPASHRFSLSSVGGGEQHAGRSSSSLSLSTPRYEETAYHRQELEEAKRENERLRRRIRELEATLKERSNSTEDLVTRSTTGGTSAGETLT